MFWTVFLPNIFNLKARRVGASPSLPHMRLRILLLNGFLMRASRYRRRRFTVRDSDSDVEAPAESREFAPDLLSTLRAFHD